MYCSGPLVEVALATGAAERRADLRGRQAPPELWAWRLAQHRQRLGVSEVGAEGVQGAGVVGAKRLAQLVDLPLAGPHQVLRTRSASTFPSPESDFAPETAWRSR
jgi:hypothetical protein